MMKKLKIRNLIKICLMVFLFGLLAISGRNLYGLVSRAKKIDEKLVESYRPALDLGLVKQAAESLKKND